MRNKFLFSCLFFIALAFVSCKGDDSLCCPHPTNCNKFAVIDEAKYNQTDTNKYTVTNVALNDNCLEITISSSGCNPDNWDMNLIGVASTTNIFPPLFHTKVELINNEACLAVFQKTVSFDVTPFQITGQNQVQINIAGWNNNIVYQY